MSLRRPTAPSLQPPLSLEPPRHARRPSSVMSDHSGPLSSASGSARRESQSHHPNWLPSPYGREPKPAFFAYSERRGPQVVSMGIILLLTLLATAVRLYNLQEPPQVVFDEVHFGGFATKYINSEFFMDVHPPLGKLIVAGSGVLLGYNGSFSFQTIGLSYIDANVPYVAMRGVPAFMGALLSPIAYTTMRNFGFSSTASVLTSILVMFENAFVCQFRLILLDSFLVFFTGLTAMLWTEFRRVYDRPFSPLWWRTLAFTGIGLGLTISVKWVGLFTIALIGVATLQDLWDLVTNGTVPVRVFFRHFMARAICLIIVPLAVYAFFFHIHFSVLYKKGTGSGFMSPEFQSTLFGSEVEDTRADVAYGSKIALRHEATRGGYLHSHPHNYPDGSKQQQMTCYPFRDENSWFLIKPKLGFKNATAIDSVSTGFDRLTHGSIVRLEHSATTKRLHSHDVRPGFNDDKDYNEASGYGWDKYPGDENDYWVVELADKDKLKEPYTISAIYSRIRFKHFKTGCYLFSRDTKLPAWGFGQQEVSCAKNGLRKLSIWRIEFNEHPEMPADVPSINYKKPNFIEKLLHVHQVMWQLNNGLKGSHPYDSRPDSWPFLRRGIAFWRSSSSSAAIYLLGNPLIWLLSLGSLVIYIGYEAFQAVASRRGVRFINLGFLKEATSASWFLFLGWCLHYLPFFLMRRQLFLHHYLPSLYFSILLFGALFDVVTLKLRRYGQLVAAIACGAAAIWVFMLFAPITFGTEMTKDQCNNIKWLSTWDFSCDSAPITTQSASISPSEGLNVVEEQQRTVVEASGMAEANKRRRASMATFTQNDNLLVAECVQSKEVVDSNIPNSQDTRDNASTDANLGSASIAGTGLVASSAATPFGLYGNQDSDMNRVSSSTHIVTDTSDSAAQKTLSSEVSNPRRKSSLGGRRVSFAATAHVRLFDKDSNDWPHEAKKPSDDELLVDRDLFGESDSTVRFQMPDIMSVRRSSLYNLGIPFKNGITAEPESQSEETSEPNISMDIDSESNLSLQSGQQSFEVDIKDSPISHMFQTHLNAAEAAEEHTLNGDSSISLSSDDMDMTTARGAILSSQSMAKLVELLRNDESTPKQPERFLYSMTASPDIVDSPARVRPKHRDSIAPFFTSLKTKLEAIPPLSPRRNQSPLSTPKYTKPASRRDSVACFFNSSIAPSPLAHSSTAKHYADESLSNDIQNETSLMMDLASDAGDENPSQESHYMSVSNTMSLDRVQDVFLSSQESLMSVDINPANTCDMSLDIDPSQSSAVSMDTGKSSELSQESLNVDMALPTSTMRSVSSASKSNAKYTAIIDTNDTITRFFAAPSVTDATQLTIGSVYGSNSKLAETNNSVNTGNWKFKEDHPIVDSTGDIEKKDDIIVVGTPARRIMPRRDSLKKTPVAEILLKAKSSYVSKKESTPAKPKSALKNISSIKKEHIESSSPEVHFDIGSPITRSRSKALKSPGLLNTLPSQVFDHNNGSPLRQKLASKSASLTNLMLTSDSKTLVSTPKSGSCNRRRKSLSAKKLQEIFQEELQQLSPTPVHSATDANSPIVEPKTEHDVSLGQSDLTTTPTTPLKAVADGFNPEEEDNLLDEHMSVVDSSFFHDAEVAPVKKITTLKDFLMRTGIEYMDNLTTRLRRDTNAFQSNNEGPTIHEYLKATCLYFPELEIYEFACHELTQSIGDGKITMDAIEEDAAKNTPIIFFEFEHGSQEERDEMINHLRLCKSYSRLEAKQSWYSWRGQLIDPMQAALEENRKRFNWDKLLIDEYYKQLSMLNASATAYRDDLQQKTIELQATNAQAVVEEAARIVELTELETAQSLEIESLNKELERLQHQTEIEVAAIAHAEAKLIEISGEISKSEEVAFYKQGSGYSVKLALLQASDESKLSKIWLQTNSGLQVVDGVGAQNIQVILNRYEQLHSVCQMWDQMKQVLDDVAYTFENLKMFWREVQQTRPFCPLISVEEPAMEGFVMSTQCSFFSLAKKIRFSLRFGFSDSEADGLFHYPCGRRSSKFELQYGDISSEKVLSSLASFDTCSGSTGVGLLPSLCLTALECME
ncbi:hypothetical protein BASA83_012051 [Batrachochytrium salamandrivorans]|nr:hypothetical protein BASA83_012051 [Batrachochytrium salamandrivorans]